MKVSRLAVVFSVLFICFVSVALAQSGIGGWITAGITLNIRSGPGTNYQVVSKLATPAEGVPVWLDGRSGDSKWYHSGDISGVSGWFSSKFFEVTEGSVSSLPVLEGEQVSPPQTDPTTVVASGGNSGSCWQDAGNGFLVGGHIPTTRGFDTATLSKLIAFEQAQFGYGILYGTTYIYFVDSRGQATAVLPDFGRSAARIGTATLTADGCGLQSGTGTTVIVILRFVSDAAWTFGAVSHEVAHDYGAIHGSASWDNVRDADRTVSGIQDAYFWSVIAGDAYAGTCDKSIDVNFCHNMQVSVFN